MNLLESTPAWGGKSIEVSEALIPKRKGARNASAGQILLDHLDRISDNNSNIPSLKKVIVALAIQGELTADGEGDLTPEAMIAAIDAKRGALAEGGVIRRSKQLGSLKRDEIPFEQETQNFVRLGRVADIQKGLTGIQSAPQGDYTLVVTGEARSTTDHFDFEGAAAIIPMVSSTGHGNASIKRLHYQEGRFALGNILCAVFPIDPDLVSARFLYEYLNAFREELLVSRMIGTANVSLTIGSIADVPIPLVPPSVQGKVDELMALCDRLEAAQAERERRRERLNAASLARLNAPAADPQTFRTHATFHLTHLPRLTTRPEAVLHVRELIRRLALSGQLVNQNSDDKPAADLLTAIENQRSALLQMGYPTPSESITQRKKQKEQLVPEGLPMLPIGWRWATLMQCSALIVDCHNKTAPYTSSGIPLLRTTNVRHGKLNFNDPKFVTEDTYIRWSSRCMPEPGDIVITREAPMGEVATIPKGMRICLGQRMMLIRLVPQTINPAFILHSLQDPMLMERVQDKPVGATVQHLRVGGVETLLMPVPPLAEQARIVAKVDELMGVCDRLEASLTDTETESRRLLESLLQASLVSS